MTRSGFDIAINATPLGTYPGDPLPMDPSRLSPAALVGEVVLKPATTAFLAAAKARGMACVTGLDMLFEQIPAYLEFFGFPSGDRSRAQRDGRNKDLARGTRRERGGDDVISHDARANRPASDKDGRRERMDRLRARIL